MSGLILRSEVEVAADTLVALLAHGLVANDPRTVARALMETGLDAADLDAARVRWERRYWQPPHRVIAQEAPPIRTSRIVNHDSRPAAPPRAPRPSEAARSRAIQPEPGYRTCQGPCNRTLPVHLFDVHGPGFKARCRSCDGLPRLTPCAYCGTLLECGCGR